MNLMMEYDLAQVRCLSLSQERTASFDYELTACLNSSLPLFKLKDQEAWVGQNEEKNQDGCSNNAP